MGCHVVSGQLLSRCRPSLSLSTVLIARAAMKSALPRRLVSEAQTDSMKNCSRGLLFLRCCRCFCAVPLNCPMRLTATGKFRPLSWDLPSTLYRRRSRNRSRISNSASDDGFAAYSDIQTIRGRSVYCRIECRSSRRWNDDRLLSSSTTRLSALAR